MPTASPPVLRWSRPGALEEHFTKHVRDLDDCLKKSLGSHPLDKRGYTQKIKETVDEPQFLFYARIRNRQPGAPENWRRKWAFAPNLFCVALNKKNGRVVSAYHNHLEFRVDHHKLFEQKYKNDQNKQDAFLVWLKHGEEIAASAKLMLGTNVSHEITDVERLKGF